MIGGILRLLSRRAAATPPSTGVLSTLAVLPSSPEPPLTVPSSLAPAATEFILDGIPFVSLPGGLFVMGSSHVSDAPPHWVTLSPFSIGKTAVTREQFERVMGDSPGISPGMPLSHPVRDVRPGEADDFLEEFVRRTKKNVTLPTEAEWEYAARGPAVDLRRLMREEGVAVDDFAGFVRDRFENFVASLEMGQRIFVDPNDRELRRILRGGQPLYGWRVYPTPSGRLTHEEVWYGQKDAAPADWGPPNGYGLKYMTGHHREMVADGYKPGSYRTLPPQDPFQTRGDRFSRGGDYRCANPVIHQAGSRQFSTLITMVAGSGLRLVLRNVP